MANVSSIGIGSGVLTSDLIEQLTSAERKPTEARLDAKQELTDTKLSEVGRLKSAATDLRLASRFLANPNFMGSSTVESNNSAISATTTGSPKLATYQMEVTNLATAHVLNSGVFTDKDTTQVGSGTLTLDVGGVSKNIIVDSSNNTLQGIADEINSLEDMGVSASVINTGSGYQLSLVSEETGTENAISISVADSDGNSTDTTGLSQFAFNATTQNLTEGVAAEDLQLNFNGINVTRSSNTVDDLVNGVTFDITGETTGTPATLKVQRDSEAVAEKVQEFVDKYNGLQEIIKEVTAYDPGSGEAGALLGEASVRSVSTQLRSVIYSVVPGLENAEVRSLAEIGISTNKDNGQLSFDTEIFKEKLESNTDDIAALFADQGRTSGSGVEFIRSGINTSVGSYDINITQAATQGSLAGSVALTGNTVIDADNDEFTIKIDGVESGAITLTQNATGYTDTELVAEIQKQIDADAALSGAGKSVIVGLDASNQLTFTSSAYGSASSVEIVSSDTNSAATLGMGPAVGTAGLDVQGTINGVAAVGEGQVLTGAEGDASEGVSVRITGTAVGDRGSVTHIEGVADQLVDTISGFLGVDGILTATENRLNSELQRISDERLKLDDRINTLTERLSKQFTAADILVSRFKSTGDFVMAQLDALAGISTKDK